MYTYVYALLDPTEKVNWVWKDIKFLHRPFYIGIGVDKRSQSHGTKSDLKLCNNKYKVGYFNTLKEKGVNRIIFKIKENIERYEAEEIEIELIDYFKRMVDGGILTNIKSGGNQTIYNNLGNDNPHSKKVYQYDLSGNFIKEWSGLRSIGRILNICYNTVGDSCRDNKKHNRNGHKAHNYMWFYEYKGEKTLPYKIGFEKEKIIYMYDVSSLRYIGKSNSCTNLSTKFKTSKSNISVCCLKHTRFRNFILSYEKLNKECLLNIRKKYIYYEYTKNGNTKYSIYLKDVAKDTEIDYKFLKGRVFHNYQIRNFKLTIYRPNKEPQYL